ncbi:putative MFS monosaccharide transporter [Lineolata rhizophorae]|uniref:Putative MFS monosaccharide transporter n=1 Tax=Lineolata rhizophorae TaxID=578093 RepID=A0A6A6PBI7_9PEZI|nr:putative MFS monosaccharide transporter [Lineolata rhizophorae]
MSGAATPETATDVEKQTDSTVRYIHPRVILMGILVSMGGFIFGYDTGQISGFLEMSDFLDRFADQTDADGNPAFSNSRSGAIVGLLSIGTLIGAIIAGPIADKLGRKYSIILWNIVFIVGVIVQIVTTTKWYQIAIGRWVAGLGVGGLSVLTPMYQSETAPRQVRGALVSCYQLFITLGIFTAYCINYGTEDDYSGAPQWRIPIGIGFIWPVVMAVGILFLPESPRWDYRKGNVDRAVNTISKSYGVPETHQQVVREVRDIKAKLDAETAGGAKHHWYEIFTGPRMLYRTILGIVLQALQQLVGANYFFYYGTTIFTSTGLSNSYVTSMILGGVNFGTTFLGLYVVDKFGRRKSLITGALWMFVCFMIFASVGHYALNRDDPQATPSAGTAMIVFACLFIAGFASTWGPIVWAVVGETYPSRYRARAMGIATASNWTFNFLISFFTPFITADIDFAYGYVFGGCCFVGAVVVYLFVCETQGRSLEEIDTMYVLKVKPWKSSKWRWEDDLTAQNMVSLGPEARQAAKRTEQAQERREVASGEANGVERGEPSNAATATR